MASFSKSCRGCVAVESVILVPRELQMSSSVVQSVQAIGTDGTPERLHCGFGDDCLEVGLKGAVDGAHRGLHPEADVGPFARKEEAEEENRPRLRY